MRSDEDPPGALPDGGDPPPPVRDARRWVTAGRVRRMGRHGATVGVSAVLLVGGSLVVDITHQITPKPRRAGPSATSTSRAPIVEQAPPAPTQCRIMRLPLPSGQTEAIVTGADPTGRYLVGRGYPGAGAPMTVIVWNNRKPTVVLMPGDERVLKDINSSGVAVGTSYTGTSSMAFGYRDGRARPLPGGGSGQAKAINEAGTVVGDVDGRPVVWRSVDSQPTPLTLPGGTNGGTAVDIDEDGTVVGTVSDIKGGVVAPVWWGPDGAPHELPVPADVPTSGRTDPKGLAAENHVYNIRAGWVTGQVNGRPIVWNVRTGDQILLSDVDIRADAVNRYGWLTAVDNKNRPRLLTQSGTLTLPDLYSSTRPALGTIPTTLSDDGRTIGGQSTDDNGTLHAVVWSCS